MTIFKRTSTTQYILKMLGNKLTDLRLIQRKNYQPLTQGENDSETLVQTTAYVIPPAKQHLLPIEVISNHGGYLNNLILFF